MEMVHTNFSKSTLVSSTEWSKIIDLVVQSVDSPHSKRAYHRALVDFLDWYNCHGRPGFTKASINGYREYLLQAGKSRSSINQALSAIRKLATEAADNGLVAPVLARGIENVKGVKQSGIRAGNWLAKDEAETLVNTPIRRFQSGQIPEMKAVRDQAILGIMIGVGLRREEVAGLNWEQIQQRDGRWVIIDLMGKRGRIRSIGIPPWVKVSIDRWGDISGVESGCVFRALNKAGELAGSVKTKGGQYTDGTLSSQAIYNVVVEHAVAAGFTNGRGGSSITAHDLRRTAAALALKGGADLRQIQQMLGHSSITTTERYLEPMQNLQVTAGDYIYIELDLVMNHVGDSYDK